MDALDVNQLSEKARAILKNDAPVARLIMAAMKPDQQGTDLISPSDMQSNSIYPRCGGANRLDRNCLSPITGQSGSH